MHSVTRRGLGVFILCLLSAGASAPAQSVADGYTPVTEAMLLDPPPENWPIWRAHLRPLGAQPARPDRHPGGHPDSADTARSISRVH